MLHNIQDQATEAVSSWDTNTQFKWYIQIIVYLLISLFQLPGVAAAVAYLLNIIFYLIPLPAMLNKYLFFPFLLSEQA